MSTLREVFRAALVERFGVEIPCDLDPEWAEEIALAWVEERLTGAREDVALSSLGEHADFYRTEAATPWRNALANADAVLDVIWQALGKGAGA